MQYYLQFYHGLQGAMSIVQRIRETATGLTPSERRLVETLMDHPADAASVTASALARSVGVHEATASRLARKLGYGSYAAFRGALREEFIPTRETATRLKKTLTEAADGSILKTLAQQEADALGRIEEFISPAQIKTVAKKLVNADRLFLFGQGNAETLALMLLKRFRRFGQDVHMLSADPRSLAEQALSFRTGDVVLAFALRRAPHAYEALITTAREAGTETVVVSDTMGATLVPQPDYLLTAPRSGDKDAFQTLTVPMTICNALVIAAGQTTGDTALKSLDRLGDLIGRFE